MDKKKKLKKSNTLKIMLFNTNGCFSKIEQIQNYITKKDIDIALLNELKMDENRCNFFLIFENLQIILTFSLHRLLEK